MTLCTRGPRPGATLTAVSPRRYSDAIPRLEVGGEIGDSRRSVHVSTGKRVDVRPLDPVSIRHHLGSDDWVSLLPELQECVDYLTGPPRTVEDAAEDLWDDPEYIDSGEAPDPFALKWASDDMCSDGIPGDMCWVCGNGRLVGRYYCRSCLNTV